MEEYMDICEKSLPPSLNVTSVCAYKRNLYKTLGLRDEKKTNFTVCNSEQTVWICSQYSKNNWVLMCGSGDIRSLQKNDFSICCKIPVDTFHYLPLEVEYNDDPFLFENENFPPESPILRFVSCRPGCDLPMKKSLFAAIFGREAFLSSVKSGGVCLIGLPDGRVLWWQKPNDNACLLYHLRQPVVDFIQGPAKSLLLIGFHGKVLSFCHQQKILKNSCAFLSGTVTSVCYKDNIIFHTTSSGQLFRSTVCIDTEGEMLINQSLLPVTSAKQVMYDRSQDRVRFLDAENIISDVPADRLDESHSLSFQRTKLHSLTEAIAEQTLRIQALTETTEQYSVTLHDLTCAAWLLTSERGDLECSCAVVPILCEETVFVIRVTFKGLKKLVSSGRWSVCISLSQSPAMNHSRKLSKSMPISQDTISMDMQVKLCWGSKVSTWGGTLRPPLDLECSVMFNGKDLALCPGLFMQIPIHRFLLDEFYFLNTGDTNQAKNYDQTLETFLYSIAEQKKRKVVDRLFTPSIATRRKCRVGFLTSNQTNPGAVPCEILPQAISGKEDEDLRLLGNPVRFCIQDNTNVENQFNNLRSIHIDASSISILAAFRRAVTERIKDLKMQSKDIVTISKEAHITAQRLLSKFQEYQGGRSLENAIQFYLLLRNELSANLPVL